MSDPGSKGGWIVRKPDGTEIRFPSLESLSGYIDAGIVTPGDVVAPQGDHWASVEDLAELGEILKKLAPATRRAASVSSRPAPPLHVSPEPIELEAPLPLPPPMPPPAPVAPAPEIDLDPPTRVDGPRTQIDPPRTVRQPTVDPLPPLENSDTVADLSVVPLGAQHPLSSARVPPPSVGVQLPSLDSIGPAAPPATRRRPTTQQVPLPPPLPTGAIVEISEPGAAPVDPGALDEESEFDELLAQLTPDPVAAPREPVPLPALPNAPGTGGPSKLPTRRDMLTLPVPPDPADDTANALSSRQIRHATAGADSAFFRDDAIGDVLRQDRRNRVVFAAAFVVVLLLGAGLWFYLQQRGATEPATPTTEGASSDAVAAANEGAPTAPPPTVVAAPASGAQDAEGSTGATPSAPDKPDAAAASAPPPSDAGPSDVGQPAAPPEEEAPSAEGKPAKAKGPAPDSQAKPPRAKTPPKSAPPAPSKPAADPGSFDGLMRAAHRAAKRRPAEALRLYLKALGKKPTNADALGSTARLYTKLGQPAKALAVLKTCRKVAPRYSPCLYRLGRAFQAAGKSGEARKAYERYLSDFPDGSYAADARKRVGP